MRVSTRQHGVSVKAYAGTTGVMLAFDVAPEQRKGLLGFAIEREGGNRPHAGLPGCCRSPAVSAEPASSRRTWRRSRSSAGRTTRVFPDTNYTYTVHPVYGEPGSPRLDDGPTVTVRTVERHATATTGCSSTARPPRARRSRATSLRSRQRSPPPSRETRRATAGRCALRGSAAASLEQITGFCARALDPTWALDVAIYEYELQEIRRRRSMPHATRGADVRIVYHAKPGDEQTDANESTLADWPAGQKRARVTTRICHDKFIVPAASTRPARAAGGAVRLDELHPQRRLPPGERRPHRRASRRSRSSTSTSSRSSSAATTPRRTKKWINEQQPAVAATPDRRRLLAAQRRDRPRPVRRRDPGAARDVLSAPRSTSTSGSSRRCSGSRTTTSCASGCRTRASDDHRHAPRPHRRLRRDRDDQRRASRASSRSRPRARGQHPHPHEARRHRLHVRRADGHQRLAQPLRHNASGGNDENFLIIRGAATSPTATASSSCASTTTTAPASTTGIPTQCPSLHRDLDLSRPTTAGPTRTSKLARLRTLIAVALLLPLMVAELERCRRSCSTHSGKDRASQ